MAWSLPFVLLIQYAGLAACGVPRLTWQYVSLREVKLIGFALLGSSGLLLLWRLGAMLYSTVPAAPPTSVILIDLLLGCAGVVGLRVSARLRGEWLERQGRVPTNPVKVPTLLIGAGSAGAAVAKAIAAHPESGIEPVGFLDDDLNRIGTVIHGTPILGVVDDVASIVQSSGARQALITLGDPAGQTVRRIFELCKTCSISTKIIPGILQFLKGHNQLAAIREVAIEDLLCRQPVSLDIATIGEFVQSRKILITGAGGSIGSELCRVVSFFKPTGLLLVEHAENNLFHLHRELVKDFPHLKVIPVVADICERPRMEQIFAAYKPDMVLHAAAHKHVPLMEWNPGEAIKNNVLGTRTIAELAHAHGVGEFVMISTDKAVNPTSIMGVSKRIAEICIQALSQRSSTRFVTVRSATSSARPAA
jgi:FlaA1/EpsC-like NDP-sugar epimerase